MSTDRNTTSGYSEIRVSRNPEARREMGYRTVAELAHVLRIPRQFVWGWVEEGDLPVVTIGKRTLITKDAYDAAVKAYFERSDEEAEW
jgi:excisionase family DNA binding protein